MPTSDCHRPHTRPQTTAAVHTHAYKRLPQSTHTPTNDYPHSDHTCLLRRTAPTPPLRPAPGSRSFGTRTASRAACRGPTQ
eukprot:252222-Chlamydomonas_euryale.AAC.1